MYKPIEQLLVCRQWACLILATSTFVQKIGVVKIEPNGPDLPVQLGTSQHANCKRSLLPSSLLKILLIMNMAILQRGTFYPPLSLKGWIQMILWISIETRGVYQKGVVTSVNHSLTNIKDQVPVSNWSNYKYYSVKYDHPGVHQIQVVSQMELPWTLHLKCGSMWVSFCAC